MNKTFMQVITENRLKDGMTYEEIERLDRSMSRMAVVTAELWSFENECEEKKIRPTFFRFKQYLKRQEAEQKEFRKNFKKYRTDSNQREES